MNIQQYPLQPTLTILCFRHIYHYKLSTLFTQMEIVRRNDSGTEKNLFKHEINTEHYHVAHIYGLQ